MHDAGEYVVKECSMAKLLSSELTEKVMTQCLQFFGGYGFMEEYKIARAYRDCRVGTIGGGSSEIMREIIAKMVIDEKSYERAGSLSSSPVSEKKPNPSAKTEEVQINPEPKSDMSFETVLKAIQEKAASAKPLGNTLKFHFGDNNITIDGREESNKVLENHGEETDCTVDLAIEDLMAMLDGNLNPMTAFMSGKIKVKGDMSVAMKLPTIMQ